MPSDPIVLGFDTSAAHCAAALLSGTGIVAARHEEMGRGQAERLMTLLEETLSEAGVAWSNLDAIGVGTGPGNFTGIRISVSAARGLALGLGIPAVGVDLFDAAAWGAPGPALICHTAPRGTAYLRSCGMVRDIGPVQMAIDTIPADWAEAGLSCIGSAGAEVAAHLGVSHVPVAHAPAVAVARIAATRWQVPQPRPAPLYLRPADAAPPRDAPPVILDDA